MYLKKIHKIMDIYWHINPFQNGPKNLLLYHTGSLDIPPNYDEGTPSESMVLLLKNGLQIIIFNNKRNTKKESLVDLVGPSLR